LRTLRRLGVRPADLEDCGQEVFVVVHRKLGAFDGRSLPGWLFSICNRVASDYRKRAYVRHEEPTFELPDAGVAPSQWCDLEQTRAREFLESVLLDLDEDKRDVFLLYELEEMSMPEVATALGCPVQTAYSRHRSAREHLERAIRKARLGHP
jgi:RNA polymerase sigma-70 factor (ECF subfamily)